MCNSVKKLMANQMAPVVQKGALGLGESLPEFVKKAVVNTARGIDIVDINHKYASEEGYWLVLFWWPKDFTFVCPTEIIAFDAQLEAFEMRQAKILGASTDTEYTHIGWRESQPQLKQLRIPMLADTSKSLAEAMGILDMQEKVAQRATFILNPQGKIEWLSIYPMNVGRNVDEVLRVLDALQTGALTACNWKMGQETLDAVIKKDCLA